MTYQQYRAVRRRGVGTGRRCRECKRIFTPPKHNTLYCPDCAAKRAKRSKRDWARKKRAGA